MRITSISRVLSPALLVFVSGPLFGQGISFSTTDPASIDGPGGPGSTQFGSSDVVQIDVGSGVGSIYLLEETINGPGMPNMNALFVASDGSIIFSTQSGGAGYDFQDDELVLYDPVTDTLSLFYDFGTFITSNDADIGGFHLMDDGTFLIANIQDFTLDGQSFTNGDIVHWDPFAEAATPFFDEGLFDGTDDIWVRSVHMLANGNLVLSAFNEDTGGSMTLGGVTFGRGDLVEYNLMTGVGSLFLDSSVFGGSTEQFDAVSNAVIPLPPAVWLFISALALLGQRKLRA